MGLKPIKVSQLNSYIKRILQTDPILGNVSVIGEVSNLKFHGSGHVYFSLKDESSKINCFLAAGNLAKLTCDLQEGMEITANGYIYLYERGGSYSLNVRDIEAAGQGDLAIAFEKLKKKLDAEGMFDPAHKKDLPAFPKKIAVVTSETGAAVRDILKIIKKKNDYVDILIYPVLVQGPNAAGEISAAIDDLNENHRDVDVIITGRGGGSMEELWAFNEEIVARSIYSSRIPVISAVGHETDFTIADFVADLRAETPTAAAERAVPDTGQLREYLDSAAEQMKRDLKRLVDNRRQQLRLSDPEQFRRDIQGRIVLEQLRIDNMRSAMEENLKGMMTGYKARLSILKEFLDTADPKSILAKGYSVVTDEKGAIVKDAGALKVGQKINIEAARGQAEGQITRIQKGEKR
ncbi:MAG: exodeoxyribonuclease VII large subunit [Bacillota bacterium]|nr:exodeoxyribonuclease VII large subunit [Bacillota bacterium]